jgi:hypothetical protein
VPEGAPLLSASFNRAVRYGWLAANPCLQATKPKVTTREIEPPTPEQVRALIVEAAEVNEDLVVCLRLAATTGARRGELVALTWSDFVGERLTIRRSVVESDGRADRAPHQDRLEGPPHDRRRCRHIVRRAHRDDQPDGRWTIGAHHQAGASMHPPLPERPGRAVEHVSDAPECTVPAIEPVPERRVVCGRRPDGGVGRFRLS